MRGVNLRADPLWHCLCPSWNTSSITTLTRSAGARNTTSVSGWTRSLSQHPKDAILSATGAPRHAQSRDFQQPRSTGLVTTVPGLQNETQRRGYSTGATLNANPYCQSTRQSTCKSPQLSQVHRLRHHNRKSSTKAIDTPLPFGKFHERPDLNSTPRSRRFAPPNETSPGNLQSLSRHGRVDECRKMVRKLVMAGEKPNVEMYNAMILSNTHDQDGAAWAVHRLLKDMEDLGIELNEDTCHNVLKVLAVHPDHLLRADILQHMQERWLTLTDEGQCDVTVGLLREGAFEMALERLDKMQKEGIKIEPWLLDMFIYMLSDAGEMEASYRMVRSRWENQDTFISTVLWYWLLDTASAARYYPMTEFIWRTQVELDHIQASNGMCMNIMSTAAKAGDPALATDVFRHLTQRGDKSTSLMYQLLLDSYMSCNPPDIDKALSVLVIMSADKLKPTLWQTRSLFTHLKSSSEQTQAAFDFLLQMHEDGKDVPIAAVNLVIECFVHQKKLENALQVYKQLHMLIRPGQNKDFADVETFNLLVKGCRVMDTPQVENIAFVVTEMLASRVRPDAITYDRLILVFVTTAVRMLDDAKAQHDGREENLESCLQHLNVAVQYLHELETLGWKPRWTTLELLTNGLADTGDARARDLLRYADQHSIEGDTWDFIGPRVKKHVKQKLRQWEEAAQHGRSALDIIGRADHAGAVDDTASFDALTRLQNAAVAS